MIFESTVRTRRRRTRRQPGVLLAVVAALLGAACDSPADLAIDTEQPDLPAAVVDAPSLAIVVSEPGCGEVLLYAASIPGYPEAYYQICWPPVWNGSFIAYGHGYVTEFQELAIPSEALELAAFSASQGFAFASTSYQTNGLAIREGVEDMAALAQIVRAEAAIKFPAVPFVPILAAGASEGGAVVTLAAESDVGLFQGTLSTCGPTGHFQRQLKYLGDFNVLFNYFFPQVFADGAGGFLVTPVGVAPPVIQQIELLGEEVFAAQLAGVVSQAVAANPSAAQQLLKVAGVAYDAAAVPGDTGSGLAAILGLLRYNVFATNDAIAKLGGSPYNNRWTWYRGSGNDWRLNSRWTGVKRYAGDAGARSVVAQHYETDGELQMPYVSLHTTGDDIIEFVQQPTYRIKALFNGSALEHSALPILRYGHCAFEDGDLVVGLGLLMFKVGAATPAALTSAMPSTRAARTFQDLLDRDFK